MIKDKVWYCSYDFYNKLFKIIAYEDIGKLNITSTCLKFDGQQRKFLISNDEILDMELINNRIRWINLLVINGFSLFYLLNARNSLLYVLGFMIIINGLYFLIIPSVKWIKITTARKNVVLLADGRIRGWGGIFGGTRKLFIEMTEQRKLSDLK